MAPRRWLGFAAAALSLSSCSPRAPAATAKSPLPAPTPGDDPGDVAALQRVEAGPLVYAGRGRVFVPGLTDVVALSWDPTDHLIPSYCALERAGEVVCWRGPSTHQTEDDLCAAASLPRLAGGCGLGPLRPAEEYGTSPLMMDLGCFIRADRRGGCMASQTLDGLEDVVEIDGVPNHGCARTGSGDVWCWGARGRDVRPPARIDGLVDVVQVTESNGLGCARLRAGGVLCWNLWAKDPAPRPIHGLGDVIDIDLGSELCVVHGGGEVRCGQADAERPLMRPIRGIADALEVESFDTGMCVRTRGGEVRCAGRRYAADKDVAVTIVGAVAVVRLVAVDRLDCAVTRAGEVLCWIPGPAPEAVRPPELAGILDYAGRCVVEADGRVSCWVPDPHLVTF